eukprot:CAMPEP_0202900734 /NCGR_PEP_ID=MMETSP1392-20130828/12006_2 /ASSEMBLY_ACC=CAM_ASM_000868 /TAXON_ID=225041 /ORGANISM="Chlamydomonas chlamydogama, Strain SAG 11-48b" /LENGTH=55 /DNA_ID=CAMNT_0049587173 /DNA_START=696 /DNA_END=860 /DNA_ORIENTATION=-
MYVHYAPFGPVSDVAAANNLFLASLGTGDDIPELSRWRRHQIFVYEAAGQSLTAY